MQPSLEQQPVLLCIAGSDASACAGIQADLKTAAALQVFACTAVTAVTAQNSAAVQACVPVSAKLLGAQLDSVLTDYRVAAIKLGLIANRAQVRLLQRLLSSARLRHLPVVMDTPRVASAGQLLTRVPADAAGYRALVARANLLTPNLPEALALTGVRELPRSDAECYALAQRLLALGPAAVLLKGGHRPGPPVDLLCTAQGGVHWFKHARIDTTNSRGTGCTLATAVAALLVRGASLEQAVVGAVDYVQQALRHSAPLRLPAASVAGPLWHFPSSPGAPLAQQAVVPPIQTTPIKESR